jgi:hypothetical protein
MVALAFYRGTCLCRSTDAAAFLASQARHDANAAWRVGISQNDVASLEAAERRATGLFKRVRAVNAPNDIKKIAVRPAVMASLVNRS